MKEIIWKNISTLEQKKILLRPQQSKLTNIIAEVEDIIHQVRKNGDQALQKLTAQFDKAELLTLQVSEDEFIDAEIQVSLEAKLAIKQAAENITRFHQQQYPQALDIQTHLGILCQKKARPIQKVGLYIPGGTAPLPSTVLMLGIPSQIAQCPLRILCTPPNAKGYIDPHILWTAQQCGIKQIFKIGGAQAIAALAYGTETVPKVDKIFGPGNTWVTQAKLLVAQDPLGAAYDLPAGPSELMVIADKTAHPEFVAADLLSQAEHGVDSQVILICNDYEFSQKVQKAISHQLAQLSRRSIVEGALKLSWIIQVEHLEQACEIANLYAPEHLSIQTEKPDDLVDKIHSAGSVFLGHWSPEAAGDYASGTNHVLPTYGYARSFSGLSVADFMKQITFQKLTQAGLKAISHTIMTLAELEGLTAHKNAVAIRMQGESNEPHY
jgi:histidinol dehydrogenase